MPDLPYWDGDDRAPDVTIATGAVPESVAPLRVHTPQLQVGVDGRTRLEIEGVAVCQVDATGTQVTLQYADGARDAVVRRLLLGTVFAMLCYPRGWLPLHASAVKVGHTSLVFAAESGTGKSTLAAALIARGHTLVADDVTVVEMVSGVAMTHPGVPGLRLLKTSIEGLALPAPDHAAEFIDAKYSYAVSRFAAGSAQVDAVYLLQRVQRAASCIECLSGPAAAIALSRALFRPNIGNAIAGADIIFRAVTRLADCVPVHLLEYGDGFAALQRLVADLDERHSAASQ